MNTALYIVNMARLCVVVTLVGTGRPLPKLVAKHPDRIARRAAHTLLRDLAQHLAEDRDQLAAHIVLERRRDLQREGTKE